MQTRLWLLIGFMGLVQAHTGTYHRLQGVELCLDSRSVEVRVNADVFEAMPLVNADVTAKLERQIITTLKEYEIPFRRELHCKGDTFLHSFYSAGPSGLEGDKTYIFEAATSVGPAQYLTREGLGNPLTNRLYDVYDRTLLFEAEVTQPELFLPLKNEQMIRNLAVDWWEDNPIVERKFPWWQLVASLTITSLILTIFLRRQRLSLAKN